MLEYVRDLDRAFAIPILGVTEYPGLSAEELRAQQGAFHPPQNYVRLGQHPEIMAASEKAAAEAAIRSVTVDHPLYRFRCWRQRAEVGRWLPVPGRPSRPLRQDSPLRRAGNAEHAARWELGRHVTSIGHRTMLCEIFRQRPDVLFAHQDEQLVSGPAAAPRLLAGWEALQSAMLATVTGGGHWSPRPLRIASTARLRCEVLFCRAARCPGSRLRFR